SGLLAGRVKNGATGFLQPCRDLEQQRRLADARLAADEDHRARNDPAAEYEVELGETGLPSLRLRPHDVAQLRRDRDAPALRAAAGTRGSSRAQRVRRNPRRDDLLNERIPLAARVAAALPLRVLRAAFGAAVGRLHFRHVSKLKLAGTADGDLF